ncbi:MAG: N4 gp53-like protein [uncultured bacterium]|nr:MAG: N4 gp53-like protein [uncultured bacterium]
MVRAIEDDLLPDAIKTGVTRAIFQNGDLPDHIMEELTGSIGLKADRMYEYAKRSYVHGLPSGQIVAASVGTAEVGAVLAALEGQQVQVDYSHLGPPNSLHIGWMQTIAQFGYNTITNELVGLKAPGGLPVYLDDMVVVVPKAELGQYSESALEQLGVSPLAGASPSRPGLSPGLLNSVTGFTPVEASTTATEDYVRIRGVWESQSEPDMEGIVKKTLNTVEKTIPLVDAYGLANEDYFHVRYLVDGVPKYWMYRVGSGTHPSLDALIGTKPETNGSFFPFAYFRFDKKSEIADTTTAAYKTSKKLVKYLGMDYDEVAAAIDENPDIKDVQQAMLIMAVPANSKDQLECRYLFSFFENLHYSRGNQYKSPTAGAIAQFQWGDSTFLVSTIVIQDKRFKLSLSNRGIFKKKVAGSIGAKGTYTSGMSTETRRQEYTDQETGQVSYEAIPYKYHYYRHQITESLYEEILVVDLQLRYYIIDGHYTTGDETDDILLIPIDRSITDSYSIPDREKLYSRSLHFVFNSVQIIKVKWYQTGLFKAIITIVGIVIAVVSMQPEIAAAVLAGTSAAYLTLALIIIEKLVIGLVLGAAFKLFVKLVGIDLAFIIAIVAATYGAYQAIDAGSVAGAPWAQELIQLSTGLSKGISDNLQDMMKDLVGDYQQLSVMKDDFAKEMERTSKLLDSNNHLSPFVIFGESPNDFYNRTVHSGNIGMNGISAISNYVNVSLKLPEFYETIGT